MSKAKELSELGDAVTVDSGNVGIGTSPSTKLHVKSTSDNIVATQVSTNSVNALFQSIESASLAQIGTSGSHAFTFFTANQERMRIDSSGNLGLGVTPSALWASGGNLQLANGVFTASSGATRVMNNVVFSSALGGAPAYITSSQQATQYLQNGGAHTWYTAPSGTAGNAISFTQTMSLDSSGNVTIAGALSKGSGSFRIDHPLESKKDTHELVHSFVEAPKADLYYRGKVNLVDGTATVNIDESAKMTEGTFVALCRDVQCFTSNEESWTNVRGSVSGNILTIEAQDSACADLISWLVVGERKDQHMYDTDWTDDEGRVIVEPEKTETENQPEPLGA